MEDPVMIFSGIVFFALFLVLGFMSVISIIGLFVKKEWSKDYEPNVSVVIPMYNEENNIKKCLDALLASDYPKSKIEILMVDDGSSDKSIEIAKSFTDVRVIKQDHKGKVKALNRGTSKASNDIIITIDCDVIVQKDFIRNIVRPFSDPKVGAVSGAARVANPGSFLTAFQSIEYIYSSLLMDGFSSVFGTSFWFWGAVTSVKKDVLKKVGGFGNKTETEDFETMITIKKYGYNTVSTRKAVGNTIVPETMKGLLKQRIRWWKGMLQTISLNKSMFRPKYGIAIMLLFSMQIFWIVYSFFVIPLISYQVLYWLPYNLASFYDTFMYLFRWSNITGPFYALYMIPEWGISFVSIFGIISGVITTVMILISFIIFREKINVRKSLGVFFYFPYTIIINLIIIMGAVSYIFRRGKSTFVD